jgi:tRNA A-37 threonylcarbamoyl transferase component Bud32
MKPEMLLKSLPLLARGGQADIYDFGSGKVLRYPRRAQDYDRMRYEYAVYSSLADSGIAIPRVFDLMEVDGVPAIVMERISGPSMMEQIRKAPHRVKEKGRELAAMHLEVAGVKADPALHDAKKKAGHCITESKIISRTAKDALLDILRPLPGGTAVCHGDFHPGNILHCEGRDYVIDWSASSRGDFTSDVAHTFLLLKAVPRLPDVSPLVHRVQKFLGNILSGTYLAAIAGGRLLDMGTFSKWVLIKAAERTFYGLPSEMSGLESFIALCLETRKSDGREDRFHEMI